MAATNTVTGSLDGFFKTVYADKVMHLVPDSVKIMKMVKFRESERIGLQFHEPVVLAGEHGVTYAAAGAGAFSINTPIAMSVKPAVVNSSQLLIASRIDLEAASKAAGSKQAFVQGTRHLVTEMLRSASKRLEISCIYGSSPTGLAQCAAGSLTGVSSTQVTIVIAAAQWAPGIWAGSKNAVVNFYDGAVQVSSGSNGDFTISAVDHSTRTLTIDGTSTGITALTSQLSSDTAEIHFQSAYGNEMSGIDKILTNTSTLFGIDASSFDLWKSESLAVGGPLTLSKLFDGVAKCVEKGGLDEDVVVLCSVKTWHNLNSDAAALRDYDSSYNSKEATNGFRSIRYFSMNGAIDVMAHPFVKEGEAFMLPMKQWKRIGSTELTFNRPGAEGRFFRDLDSNAGYEFRAYANQAIFSPKPAISLKFTGIVNS